ncbi:mitochondrial import receptor subunit TOM70-like [Rhopilema esculentum]|uniref:mitochondrial import receptor subunit TOM70-like n=1 Tax=Rhopilema esculentum TaxID=499914 RepID=UPI0031DD784A|eukprot:gene16860-8335_t
MSEIPKDSQETFGLTKKELALYIGVPVTALCVAGLAYYYLTKGSSAIEETTDETETSKQDATTKADSDEAAAEKTPEQLAQSAKLKGNKYFKGGKYDSAIECYTEAITLCPKEKSDDIATFYQNRAAAHEKMKNWQEVIDDCTQAIKLMPKYTKALARRARANDNVGKKIDCLEDVTAVCLLEGFQNQEFMIMADRILKEVGKELAAKYIKERKPTLPSSFFVKSYLDSFSTDVFSINLEDKPEETESTPYLMAINDLSDKKYDDIINLCTEEIEKDGVFKVKAALLRGTMYTLESSVDKAMADFERVVSTGDEPAFSKLVSNALIKRASLKMQQAKDAECFDDFERAVNVDKDNADVYHHRGQLYFLTEKLEEAKKDFEKAIALNESFVAPRLQLGYCLCKLAMKMFSAGMMQDANKLLEQTTKKFPESAEAWSLYGQLLQDQQQFQEAEDKLEKAIDLQPQNPTSYVYKALLCLQWKRDFEAANQLIRKAIAIDDKCDFAYETLATLEVQRGNSEEAIKLFNKAIDLVRTEAEMAQTFSLLEAAKAQSKATKNLGITLPLQGAAF